MSETSFETALAARTRDMADACTRCGKCFEACPSVAPGGLGGADAVEVIGGILEILREGTGPETSRRWASVCTFSGDCIKACDYGVNPRFLLAMARIAMGKATRDLPTRRRQGSEDFRKHHRAVTTLSRLQLGPEALARLGQHAPGTAAKEASGAAPDFIFYTGCNVLKTPHIALLALDIMDALGITYRVMGGTSHCCGVMHMRAGDTETVDRIASYAVDQLSQSKSGEVIAWCPSCYVQFTETNLPTVERQRGARPFEMTPFMRFLLGRFDALKPLLRQRVEMRVALHKHPGVASVVEATETILAAIPGIELVDLRQPALGLQSVYMSTLPAYKRQLQLQELEAAKAAGIDALVSVYHSDHRELCAHERDWPFEILSVLELIAASMGLHENDEYKRLKLMQDAAAIVADCRDLIREHKLDAAVARDVIAQAMLADQPLPLVGDPR